MRRWLLRRVDAFEAAHPPTKASIVLGALLRDGPRVAAMEWLQRSTPTFGWTWWRRWLWDSLDTKP